MDAELVRKLVEAGSIAGEDAVVLFALACQRAGDGAWTVFRAQMQSLLGEQPLPGSVVVLTNRLSGDVPRWIAPASTK